MSLEHLQTYLWHIGQDHLIPKLKESNDQINSFLAPDQKEKLSKYLEWREFYDWENYAAWSAIKERAGNNSNFYDLLEDFLAVSYSYNCCKIKPVPYKEILKVATKIKVPDLLDLEKLILSVVFKEISEEENIKNFSRFGELIDSIKDPENLESFKGNLYTQTSDLVMEEPDNALELARILHSLSILAEKADYEIVKDLVEKYFKVLEYNQNILNGEQPVYEFYERTSEDDFRESLGLLRNFPFDKENKEKFQKFLDKYKPALPQEEVKSPLTPESINEDHIRTAAKLIFDINPQVKDIIDNLPIKSWNQIEFIENIFEKKDKGLKVVKAILKDAQGNPYLLDENGKQCLVAVKTNTFRTDKEGMKLGMQGMYMATMNDNSENFLKLYGSFFDEFMSEKRYTLVMEYAKETLAEKIKNLKNCGKPEREAEALKALECLVRSMKILNEKGISHRDIKPDNIFISLDGRYLIADFDASEEIKRDDYGRTIKSKTRIVGTKYYMAPEIRAFCKADDSSSGEISRSPSEVDILTSANIDYNLSDVYSLAITVLRMVTEENYTKWNKNQNLQEFIHNFVDQYIADATLKNTLKSMFIVNPNERPKFREIDKNLTVELSTKKDIFE